MAQLQINTFMVTPQTAQQVISICPFGAISYKGSELSIDARCKMCKLCIRKGPQGMITLQEDGPKNQIDKSLWRGIAVFADYQKGQLHPVSLELLGKALELATVTKHPVYVVLIGYQLGAVAAQLLRYGADKVFVYDHPGLAQFSLDPYTNVFSHFIETVKPSSILVGATNLGRSLAPRVAARFRTGLTADCTVLEMKENTDLVQIRPAFGGNIMAQIITPNHRPQFCTVRYKIFSKPQTLAQPTGTVEIMMVTPQMLQTDTIILGMQEKEKMQDISEAEIIVAVGRGVKTKEDLDAARELAELLGAQMACTRPLVENGSFDAKHQIGLSGRTVSCKLIITLGISGAVQFTAGMRGSQCIIACNTDPKAPIFDVAHYCVVGNLQQILPSLTMLCKGVNS